MIVLVQSHTDVRAAAARQQPDPDAGARWGRPSRFQFDRSAEDAELERRGGVTLVWPAERVTTVRVGNFTPVWRKIDVIRIPPGATPEATDPETMEEASVTREILFPVGTTTQKYVGGGTGYVEDPRGLPYEERVIHTFVRLRLPPPMPDAEVVRTEVEGAWPSLPTEMFRPGTFVYVPPVPGDWHR